MRLLNRQVFQSFQHPSIGDEWEINSIGHGLIFAKNYELAKEVFQFNIDEHPNEPNVFDSYGDALLAEGGTVNAIDYFRKALEFDPTFPDPKPKLKELGVEF